MDTKLEKLHHLMDIFEEYVLAFKIQHPNSIYERTMKGIENGTVGLINFNFNFGNYSSLCNDFWYSVGIANNCNAVISSLAFDIFLDFEDRDEILNSIRDVDAAIEVESKTTWARGKRMYHIRIQRLDTDEKIREFFNILFERGMV